MTQRTCLICGAITRNDKYCSRGCFFKSLQVRRGEYVTVTCPCGVEFEALANRVADGHGKFCSKPCKYRYTKMPKRASITIHQPNSGWFKAKPPEEHQTPEEKAARKRKWKQENRDKVQAQEWRAYSRLTDEDIYRRRLWTYHRMMPEDWAEMFARQGGRCYLCDESLEVQEDGLKRGKKVHIDHDYRCCPKYRSCARCRRGLACPRCNLLIGRVKDNPELLHRIAENLEKAMSLLRLED